MKDRFQDYYRNSNRLRDHDYSSPDGYFVTINTKEREPFLAEVSDNRLRLSNFGVIVYEIWKILPQKYQGLRLDKIAIMPDHVHALFWIDHNPIAGVRAVHEPPLPETTFRESQFPESLTANLIRQHERRIMIVPKVIGYWKMNSAKQINQLRDSVGEPVWQRNYFDEIIRDENHLVAVRKYIDLNNSLKIASRE